MQQQRKQVRVFQEVGPTLSEIPASQIAYIRWADNLSSQPDATVRLSTSAAITPANTPDVFIIVPSAREDRLAPVYGPYEVTSYGWDGEGYAIQGVIGADFAARFATDDNAALEAIIAQVDAFSSGNFEPFMGWASDPSPTDGPNVAKLGLDFITTLVQSSLFNVSTLSDMESLLAGFGLTAYMLVEWPAAGRNATPRLAVWPLHPLTGTAQFTVDPITGEVTAEVPVQPRIGGVRTWANNLPIGFSTPNLALPNFTSISEHANIQQFPNVNVPDMFNVPFGSPKPSYRTRRINVGYRLLGVEEEVELFQTGTRRPPIYRNPQVTGLSGVAKMGEELQRWNLQNSAADLTLKRFPDDTWEVLTRQFFVPHQVVTFPEQVFPKDWPETQRRFVIREVAHEFSAREGYSQTISATLWQGPFERLEAVTSEDDIEED